MVDKRLLFNHHVHVSRDLMKKKEDPNSIDFYRFTFIETNESFSTQVYSCICSFHPI